MCNAIKKNTTIQAVDDTMTLMDFNVLHKVVELISNAHCVNLFFGVGASALVANDFFYNKLLRINKNASFSNDTHTQLTYGANTGHHDVVIIFFLTPEPRKKCLKSYP